MALNGTADVARPFIPSSTSFRVRQKVRSAENGDALTTHRDRCRQVVGAHVRQLDRARQTLDAGGWESLVWRSSPARIAATREVGARRS